MEGQTCDPPFFLSVDIYHKESQMAVVREDLGQVQGNDGKDGTTIYPEFSIDSDNNLSVTYSSNASYEDGKTVDIGKIDVNTDNIAIPTATFEQTGGIKLASPMHATSSGWEFGTVNGLWVDDDGRAIIKNPIVHTQIHGDYGSIEISGFETICEPNSMADSTVMVMFYKNQNGMSQSHIEYYSTSDNFMHDDDWTWASFVDVPKDIILSCPMFEIMISNQTGEQPIWHQFYTNPWSSNLPVASKKQLGGVRIHNNEYDKEVDEEDRSSEYDVLWVDKKDCIRSRGIIFDIYPDTANNGKYSISIAGILSLKDLPEFGYFNSIYITIEGTDFTEMDSYDWILSLNSDASSTIAYGPDKVIFDGIEKDSISRCRKFKVSVQDKENGYENLITEFFSNPYFGFAGGSSSSDLPVASTETLGGIKILPEYDINTSTYTSTGYYGRSWVDADNRLVTPDLRFRFSEYGSLNIENLRSIMTIDDMNTLTQTSGSNRYCIYVALGSPTMYTTKYSNDSSGVSVDTNETGSIYFNFDADYIKSCPSCEVIIDKYVPSGQGWDYNIRVYDKLITNPYGYINLISKPSKMSYKTASTQSLTTTATNMKFTASAASYNNSGIMSYTTSSGAITLSKSGTYSFNIHLGFQSLTAGDIVYVDLYRGTTVERTVRFTAKGSYDYVDMTGIQFYISSTTTCYIKVRNGTAARGSLNTSECWFNAEYIGN